MKRTYPAAVFLTALLCGALAASCSDAPTTPPGGSSSSSSSSSGDTTSSSSSSSSSSGGGGGMGGAGGAGGAGGGMMALPGHTATEVVSGGQYMKSNNYSMIYTIGQPSQIQSTVSSDKYRMQGGIVGATGSLP